MKRVAIICAEGLGDGLLMMIVACQLKRAGYQPTLFHSAVKELSSLFPDILITSHPPLQDLQKILLSFDHVVMENDHSERAYFLFKLREDEPLLNHLTIFFPTPSKKFQKRDFLFDPTLPVASNLLKGCQEIFQLKTATKDNGILLPKGKIHRKFQNRIVIHPTSNDQKRNWHPTQFLKLSSLLKNEGYTISFSLSPAERSEWLHVIDKGFDLPSFQTLAQTSSYLYESGFFIGNDSGIGHLASNLNIPTLTISGNPKRVALWRPDWALGHVVTIPFPLPNFKGIGLPLRQNFWQHFIPVQRTLRAFHQLKMWDQ
jgi:heptosyltransferase-3